MADFVFLTSDTYTPLTGSVSFNFNAENLAKGIVNAALVQTGLIKNTTIVGIVIQV